MLAPEKITSADDAIAKIRDGDTICVSGFVGVGTPEELICALERRFEASGHPRNLTLVFAAAPGDGANRGLNRLAKSGLVKCVIGGHWALVPKLANMAVANEIEAYNLPLGCISQLFREIAGRKPGMLTRVGLHTFVDPRQAGGRINERTTRELVALQTIDDDEWMFYKSFPIDVAFLRATTADPFGNATMEREALTLDALSMAMATKASKGKVILQVERIAARGSLKPRQVGLPGILIDCIVKSQPEHHQQTFATDYAHAFAGELRVPHDHVDPMPLAERKIIARRAACELPINGVANLGIGMPEGVAKIAQEEGVLDSITLTAEPGVIGGIPQSGLDFGAVLNADAIIQQNQQFDFYDGGGLDMACLGMAQVDASGHVNVSRFGSRLAGAGGFINISQNAAAVVFVGTFTAQGLRVSIDNGRLRIVSEGRTAKFIKSVEQITFNGKFAAKSGQRILYVTERCVFQLTDHGLELTEVAPGIDINRDILGQMQFEPVIRNPKLMDASLFAPGKMDLRQFLATSSRTNIPTPSFKESASMTSTEITPNTDPALWGKLETIRTPEDYVASLRGREMRVFLMGELIDEPVDHPIIRPSVNAMAATYALAIENEELATVESPLAETRINRFLHIAESANDLVNKARMQQALGRKTGTCFQRCVGLDALNSLHSVTFEIDEAHGTTYHHRFLEFLKCAQKRNQVVGGAMTDAKGDRSKAPHEQADPDVYVHVSQTSDKGVFITGAKLHQTGCINSHWLMIMPTLRLGENDKAYAIVGAVPANAKGITYIYGRQSNDTRCLEPGTIDKGNAEFAGQEAMIVFKDVFIPWAHVFMNGEYEFAAMLVERFTTYHRCSYVCKSGVGDVLIGAAAEIAELNGVDHASHIKDKIVEMVHLNETIRSGALASAHEAKPLKSGVYLNDEMFANVCKQNVTRFPYEISRLAQDIAGGLMVTMPSEQDLMHKEIGPLVRKYLVGRTNSKLEDRMRILRLIENMTLGRNAVGYLTESLHGAGSPQAQRIQIARGAKLAEKKSAARKLAGIADQSGK